MSVAEDTVLDPDGTGEETLGDKTVFGRYMRPDRQEFSCKVGRIDTDEVTLISEGEFKIGEHMVAYLDELGRVEGKVIRETDDGFAIALKLSAASSVAAQSVVE